MTACNNCGAELPEGAKFCPKCGTPVYIGTSTPQMTIQKPMVLAFWGERFVAWLIDVVIFGVISFVLSFFGLFAGFSMLPGWLNWLPFFNIGLSSWIIFIYWAITDGLYGQSFGKMVMRIKVVRSNGNLPGIWLGALESVGKAFILLIDLLIGWLLHPRKRQRIFNYISDTIVVKV